jgi:hypothetical protein
MKPYYNYFLFMALIVGILYYNSATKEGFTLPGVRLPGIMRRARVFREQSVRQFEKMTTYLEAKSMMS